ncbi:GGDEF domain-containing protein [Desulfovibrio inopinatus]|uniref:GGDEF domain-containing protein n=1 Tax=Desulfovibrio inopinatus TaxID=102109 RepID=UPI0003FF1E88|nr:GGDEF domain-containing protein [Desulfovibrio inopinatus]
MSDLWPEEELKTAKDILDDALHEHDLSRICEAIKLMLPYCSSEIISCKSDIMLCILKDVLHASKLSQVCVLDEYESGTFRALIKDVLSVREFLMALATGDLSQSLTVKGYLAGALKSLQAHLKHLTWQTQMVAQGDFNQSVDFLGEFSDAFNSMIAQLEENRKRLQESEERYRHMSLMDPLTNLFNRRHLFDVLHQEVQKALQQQSFFSLIMLDVDHFKRINDKFGHAAGDYVLEELAKRLQSCLRPGDVAARYGGEEFLVVLPHTDLATAYSLAERIRLNFQHPPLVFSNFQFFVTASFGVSIYNTFGDSEKDISSLVDILCKQADEALYRAKAGGRNCVNVYP